MASLNLNFGLTFTDLYTGPGLDKVDQLFQDYLDKSSPTLSRRYQQERLNPSGSASDLIVEISPYLEDFLADLFNIHRDTLSLQQQHNDLSPLFYVKRQFVQRRAARQYTSATAAALDGTFLTDQLTALIGTISQLNFALHVQQWLISEAEHQSELELATQYAAWATLHKDGQLKHRHDSLFKVPLKTNYDSLLEAEHIDGRRYCQAQQLRHRDGFSLTDPGLTRIQALDEVNYCIWCHHQGKDSCSKGLAAKTGEEQFQRNPLGQSLTGCPLEEKISEMQETKAKGYSIAALAIICIDNPMVAGTGHRICNDCMKACIYQKQQPVNIPGVESHVLQDVLGLPWGFEIYSLLTRWNPLNFQQPLPAPLSAKNVLVVGMGPAGFTLSHYLMQSGHTVMAIDGLKIEPLPAQLLQPIYSIKEAFADLDERVTAGFGGVAEYGITVRWDKNNLLLIRLLLERRQQFQLYGGVRFGGTLTVDQAFELGIDHIALCMGAGSPTLIPLKNGLANGVRQASDFLMALQLTGAGKKDSLSNMEINLPAVVIGGGLTAIDTATEVMAYYPRQVEKFYHRYQTLVRKHGIDHVRRCWSTTELLKVDCYLEHGQAIVAERERAVSENRPVNFVSLVKSWGGVTVVYRQEFQKAPSYRNNHEEVQKALEEGIEILDQATPVEVMIDTHQQAQGLRIKHLENEKILPAQTILVAAGTKPNVGLRYDEPQHFTFIGDTLQAIDKHNQPVMPEKAVKTAQVHVLTHRHVSGKSISFFGDMHPTFAGNVVKAMASAKRGYPLINQELAQLASSHNATSKLANSLAAKVVAVNRLTPTIVEVIVSAPLAAANFQPGQFYRLQNFEQLATIANGTPLVMEGLAVTGASVDKENGVISTIVLEMGGSSNLCRYLKPGEPIILMGPTGAPTEIPHGETVILIGGGLGNAVLFSIGQAMRAQGCRVLYFAGYKRVNDRYKLSEIEAAADQVIWCCDEAPDFMTGRPQDAIYHGNIIEAILAYATRKLGHNCIPLKEADRLVVIGSDRMMAAVAKARHGVLKPYLKPTLTALASINSPMQCMMKEICAQCLQRHVDPITGVETIVYSCANQDQDLMRVDFNNLNQRLQQNSVQEKLTKLWLKSVCID